jgi:hypothetical protein
MKYEIVSGCTNFECKNNKTTLEVQSIPSLSDAHQKVDQYNTNSEELCFICGLKLDYYVYNENKSEENLNEY